MSSIGTKIGNAVKSVYVRWRSPVVSISMSGRAAWPESCHGDTGLGSWIDHPSQLRHLSREARDLSLQDLVLGMPMHSRNATPHLAIAHSLHSIARSLPSLARLRPSARQSVAPGGSDDKVRLADWRRARLDQRGSKFLPLYLLHQRMDTARSTPALLHNCMSYDVNMM
jgi:hypothetical protein